MLFFDVQQKCKSVKCYNTSWYMEDDLRASLRGLGAHRPPRNDSYPLHMPNDGNVQQQVQLELNREMVC